MKSLESRVEGAFWKTLSCICFASINGVIRHLCTQDTFLPSVELAFFQNLFASLCLIPWFLHRGIRTLTTARLDLHLWRALASGVGVVLWYVSLSLIPIAQAVALGFMGPLFSTLGARFALKEPLGLHRIIAIALGILGGILISNTRYLSGEIPWFRVELLFLIPVASTLAFSASTLMAKHLTKFDSPELTALLLVLLMTLGLGVVSLWVWVTPTATQLLWLVVLGVLAAGAHFSMNRAFACADVTFLIPFGSTRLLASIWIGVVFFEEIPSSWTLNGVGLILCAIFFLGYRERQGRSAGACKS